MSEACFQHDDGAAASPLIAPGILIQWYTRSRHKYSNCGMPSTWKPPSTRMISPVVQAPAAEAR